MVVPLSVRELGEDPPRGQQTRIHSSGGGYRHRVCNGFSGFCWKPHDLTNIQGSI